MNSFVSLAQTVTSLPEEKWVILGFALLALAIIFFAAELFLPSSGLLATLCALSLMGSTICFFTHDWRWGVVSVSIYAAGAPAAVIFGLKVWSTTPLARRMVLDADNEDDMTPPGSKAAARRAKLRGLIGAQGDAITPLRPVGVVRIAGERLDALAETGLIDAGARVVVVDVADDQIKVRIAT